MRPYLLHIHERPLTLVRFNYDGDFFLTCSKDGEVCLIRTETCERMGTYTPPGEKMSAVYAVDVTIDCEYVVTATADGALFFFQFNGTFVTKLQHEGIVKYVEWNQKPGAQNKVCTCNDKFMQTRSRIMIWSFVPQTKDRPKMQKLLTIDEDKGLRLSATKVKWGPFDETLVSINSEGTVIVWCASTGNQLNFVDAHDKAITSMNFSEDRMLMITSSKDMTAKLWAMDTVECVKTYKTDRPLNDAAISPLYTQEKEPKFHVIMGGGQDAKDVTTTGRGEGRFETMLWHMIYEEEIGTVKGHFGPMNTLAWFRNGAGFVTGGEDGYVRVHHFDSEYFTSKKFE
jgi:translation initiation factor 3 subunit I